MSLVCRFVERSLALSGVQGTGSAHVAPWVRRHLDRCAACRRVQSDFESIAGRLAEALDAPEPSDAFVERVWAGIGAGERRTAGAGRGAVTAWAAAGVLVVAAILFGSNLRTSERAGVTEPALQSHAQTADARPGGASRTAETTAGSAARTTSRVEQRAAKDEPRKPRTERQKAKDDERKANAAEKAAIRRMLLLRRRMAHAPERTTPTETKPSSATGGDATGATTSSAPAWADIGRYYEAQSDASSAAYAYRQAWHETGDTSAAYAVGRTSEAAGDILTAVECYAEMLESHSKASSNHDGVSHRLDDLSARA